MAYMDVSFDGKNQHYDYRDEYPAEDNSILNYCYFNIANRARTTQITREYKRLQPSRYKVKSKVNRNLKV